MKLISTILFLIMATLSHGYLWYFYGGRDRSFTVIEHHEPVVYEVDGYKRYKDARVFMLDDVDAFKYIISRWCTEQVDFRVYAVWAGHAHGSSFPPATVDDPNDVIVDPNDVVMPMVWVSQTGTKYHLKTCKYWKESYHEVSIFDALLDGCMPCLVCKPYEERQGE